MSLVFSSDIDATASVTRERDTRQRCHVQPATLAVGMPFWHIANFSAHPSTSVSAHQIHFQVLSVQGQPFAGDDLKVMWGNRDGQSSPKQESRSLSEVKRENGAYLLEAPAAASINVWLEGDRTASDLLAIDAPAGSETPLDLMITFQRARKQPASANGEGNQPASSTASPQAAGQKEETASASKARQSIQQQGWVNTLDGLNLRKEPSQNAEILVGLPNGAPLQILAQVGEWFYVIFGGRIGYVYSQYVTLASLSSQTLSSQTGSSTDDPTLAPPVEQRLTPPSNADADTILLCNTWNKWGGMLLAEASKLTINPGMALAVLLVESGGRAFTQDNRIRIRFENHIFYQQRGSANRTQYLDHFRPDPDAPGSDDTPLWHRDPTGPWQSCHQNDANEWEVFEFARSLDENAAMMSISMGAPQIMGFNYSDIGYGSVRAMFDAFSTDIKNHFTGLFAFIRSKGIAGYLQSGNLSEFSKVYNGPGNVPVYTARMQKYIDIWKGLQAQGRQALARDAGASSPSSLRQQDKELYQAWRRHVVQGLENNEQVFHQVFDGMDRPYHLLIWMNRVLFAMGCLSLLTAMILSYTKGSGAYSLIFGGLGIAGIAAYFITKPGNNLEHAMHLWTRLGIIYNTYWTKLTYMQEPATVLDQLNEATNSATRELSALLDATSEESPKPGNGG